MDSMVFGLDVGPGVGAYLEVATIYWRHVMLIPARLQVQIGLLPFSGAFAMRLGSLVGIGGFHGRGQRFSHWFVLGSEVIWGQAFTILGRSASTTAVGWLLPVGYDFRQHYGEDFKRVWGLRAYVAWMPLYYVKYSDPPTCDPGDFFCSKNEAPRVKVPLVAGLCVYFGFQ